MGYRFTLLLPVGLVLMAACNSNTAGTGGSGGTSHSQSSGSSSSGGKSESSSTSSGSSTSSSSVASSSSSSSSGASSSSGSSTDGGTSDGGKTDGGTSDGGASDAGASDSGITNGGTATRPLLSSADADKYTILKYLAKAGALGSLTTDNWDPTAGIDLTGVTPTYTVAADGSGTHTTVQAAIAAAVAAAPSTRTYILVKPGTYNEVVCVPTGGPQITLYGADTDASKVTIAAGHSNPEAKLVDASANPCNPNYSGTTYGTSGSATFAAYAAGFMAKNITIANIYDESLSGTSQQAVALMTQADKVVLDNVRLLGNQDTFYAKTSSTTMVARVYVKNSYIEGDVDFIFGRATLVLDTSTIKYLSTRRGATNGGTIIAPSTAPANDYGMLIINSTLSADTGTAVSTVYLGRAWDEGVATGTYDAGNSPNGQAVIRNSVLGDFVRAADPWATSTSGRAFDANGNRLYEYSNTGAGAAK